MSWDTNVDIVIGFIGFSTSDILSWLVVLTILKSMSQWEGWHPIYEMENKIHVPKHQPDIKIIKPCNNSKQKPLGILWDWDCHIWDFSPKKATEKPIDFTNGWFPHFASLSWDRNVGSEKKTSTGNVFYSFLYPKYMQLFFHNPILGRKTLWCHQTRLENPRSECFQLWNSSARHVWLPSDNWALSIYNFPTKTFIILYLSRIFHFKEDVFPTIYRWC